MVWTNRDVYTLEMVPRGYLYKFSLRMPSRHSTLSVIALFCQLAPNQATVDCWILGSVQRWKDHPARATRAFAQTWLLPR
jgi:hypothetical protein